MIMQPVLRLNSVVGCDPGGLPPRSRRGQIITRQAAALASGSMQLHRRLARPRPSNLTGPAWPSRRRDVESTSPPRVHWYAIDLGNRLLVLLRGSPPPHRTTRLGLRQRLRHDRQPGVDRAVDCADRKQCSLSSTRRSPLATQLRVDIGLRLANPLGCPP
jgi:hypothetical protein